MKKILLSISVLTLISSNLFADLKSDIQSMKIFKDNHIKVKEVQDKGSIYALELINIKGDLLNASLTKDKKVLLLSQGVDTKTMKSVKVDKDISILTKFSNMTYGTGKYELIVFTDPECPFCQKFSKLLLSLDKSKFKIHFFFLPLVSLHPNSVAEIKYILDSKTNEEKWKKYESIRLGTFDKNLISKYNKLKNKKITDKMVISVKLAQKMGISSTPTMLDLKGTMLDWNNLPQLIKINNK